MSIQIKEKTLKDYLDEIVDIYENSDFFSASEKEKENNEMPGWGDFSFAYFCKIRDRYSEILAGLKKLQPSLTDTDAALCKRSIDKLEASILSDDVFWHIDFALGGNGFFEKMYLQLNNLVFDNIKAIEGYLFLLSDTKRFFEDLLKYEHERLENGAEVSSSLMAKSVRICERIIDLRERNSFKQNFRKKIGNCSFITENEKLKYIQQFNEIYDKYFVTAYENLEKGFKTIAEHPSDTEYSDFAKKRTVYEDFFKSRTGIKKNIKSVTADLEKEIIFLSRKMNVLSVQNLDILSNIPEHIIPSYESMADVKKLFSDDFPELDSLNFSVCKTDCFGEKHSPPATVIGDAKESKVYINSTNKSNVLSNFLVFVHEIMPGHAYQHKLSRESVYDNVLSFMGFSEGWAKYCEQYAFKYLRCSEQDKEFIKTRYLLQECVNARIDIGINYDMWSPEQYDKFWEQFSGLNNLGYEFYKDNVCKQLIYAYSMLTFISLAERYTVANVKEKSMKSFHKKVLENKNISLEKYAMFI